MGVLVLAALGVGRAPAEVGQELLGGWVPRDVAGFGKDRGQSDDTARREVRGAVVELGELGRDGRVQFGKLAVEAGDLARQGPHLAG